MGELAVQVTFENISYQDYVSMKAQIIAFVNNNNGKLNTCTFVEGL